MENMNARTLFLGLAFFCISAAAIAQQPERELFIEGDKIGYKDAGGNVVIKPRFDVPDDIDENPDRYAFHEWRALVLFKGKYGYISVQGRPVIVYKYENADRFSNLRACIVEDGKCGYINRLGDVVVKPKYEPTTDWGTANAFKYGLAAVTMGKDYALLDTSGKQLTDFDYDEIQIRRGGAVLAKKRKDYALLSPEGKELTDFDFREVGEFTADGLAIVKDKKNYGIVRKDGKIILPLEYEKIEPYDKYGYAKAYKEDGSYVFYDKEGNAR